MLRTLQSMLQQVAHQCPELAIKPEDMSGMAQAAAQTYAQCVPVELLRILGLSRSQATQVLQGDTEKHIHRGLNRLLMHYATESFNTFEATPQPRMAWQLPDFWSGVLDPVAPGLREQLARSLLDGKVHKQDHAMATVLSRNAKYAATRPMLFRENLRHAIQKAVQDLQRTGQLGHEGLDAFIQAQVKANALPEDVA